MLVSCEIGITIEQYGHLKPGILSFLSSFDRKIIPDTGNPDNPESYEGGEVDAKS